MVAQLNEMEVAQLRQVLHKIADFVALFETTQEKMTAREQTLKETLHTCENFVNLQLEQIKALLLEFQEIMTESGAARWRLAAENALKEGKLHLTHFQESTKEFLLHAKESCENLDRATAYAVKNISRVINSFKPEDLHRVTHESANQITQTCRVALKRIIGIMSGFHWKNFGVVLVAILVITMMTGLYLNDEWPWETHDQVMQQRYLAKAVMNVWPDLSQIDRSHILHSLPNLSKS